MMHGRGKMGAAPASDAVTPKRCRCPRAGAVSELFIYLFIILFLHGFLPHIGQIRSYRPAAKIDRNRPKSAVNHAGTAKNRL